MTILKFRFEARMTCHLSDAQIWTSIQALVHQTGWTEPSIIIDAVSEKEGVDRDRVRQVYRERIVMGGAG